MVCIFITEGESFPPQSLACAHNSKHAGSTVRRRRHRMIRDSDRDAILRAENGYRSSERETPHHRSTADEDLYCPMSRIHIDTKNNRVVQNTPINLFRACSDETLSLRSHSRRLQHMHHMAMKSTPTHTDRLSSAAQNDATVSRSRRRRRSVVPRSAAVNTSLGGSRRTVTNNRPDLLCTRKDHIGGGGLECISPLSCDSVDRRNLSPPNNDPPNQSTSPTETANGSLPATSQSPQSIISDGSPGSQCPIAPAASPVTLNSIVFSPPPCTVVSSSPTTIWSTTLMLPPRPLMVDCRSNPDSGYGSKVYRCLDPTVAEVTSCREHNLAGSAAAGVNPTVRVNSFPDVVIDQPTFQSMQTIPAAPLSEAEFSHDPPSSHRSCQSDSGSSPPSQHVDLVTYAETSWVVSPRHVGHRQSRVPIELADLNSTSEFGGGAVSEASPLSLNSVDFVTEKVSDCILLSPSSDAPSVAVPPDAGSHQVVPQTAERVITSHVEKSNELLYRNGNSLSELGSQCSGSQAIIIVPKDAKLTGGEWECCPKTYDDSCSLMSVADDSTRVKDEAVQCQLPYDNLCQTAYVQIGRCTTV